MKELKESGLTPIEESAETDISKAIPGKKYWVNNGHHIETFTVAYTNLTLGNPFFKDRSGNMIHPEVVVYFFPYQG